MEQMLLLEGYLKNVKYCDSSGLSALLVGNRILKEKEAKFRINWD